MPRAVQSRPRAAVRLLAVALLLVCVLVAAALLLSPDGWGINRANVALWQAVTGPLGLQGTISPEQFQTGANVALFIPPFAALAVLLPRWWWVAVALLLSSAVELYQGRLGTRLMEVQDVLANTLGGAIGVTLGLLIARRMRPVDRAADEPSPRPGAPTAPTTRDAPRRPSAHGPGAAADDRD